MANEIQKSKTFEEKMKERVRDSLGELISDEELSKIIERGMEEAFFKPRTITSGYGQSETKDPLIVDVVKKLLTDSVNERVDSWLKENPEKIGETLEKVVQEGVGLSVMRALTNKFSSELFSFQSDVEQKLKSGLL